MKTLLKLTVILSLVTMIFQSCSSTKPAPMTNMVAIVEMKVPLEDVCDNDKVYTLLPFFGDNQVEAICLLTDEEIALKLNSELKFLKENPNYKDKGMLGMIINCNGDMVQCKIDNKTKSPELDAQIVAIFETLKEWQAGTYNGKAVDSMVLVSFEIEDGKITL